MDIMCPTHSLPLSIEKQRFTFGNKIYPATIGKCPMCRYSYINRRIFPGDRTTIENNTYQFLSDLEHMFPPDKTIDLSSQVPISKAKDPSKKKHNKRKNNKNKEKAETPMVRPNRIYQFISNQINRCPADGFILHPEQISVGSMGVIVKEKGLKCPKCSTVFFYESQKESIEQKVKEAIAYKSRNNPSANKNTMTAPLGISSQTTSPEQTISSENSHPVSSIPLPYASNSKEPVNLTNKKATIWVYENKCRCPSCERKFQQKTITNRTAVISTAMRDSIYVDIMFCMGCGKYFVNVLTLEVKEKAHGILMFERRCAGTLAKKHISQFTFAPDSILSRYGYSVADKDGITKQYRQAILTYIMEVVGIRKNEIEEKIKEFIQIHQKIKGHELACARWSEDLSFISNYRLKDQIKVVNPQFEHAYRGRKI